MLYIEGNCETQISFMFRLEFYLQDFSLNCKKKNGKNSRIQGISGSCGC